MNDTVDEVIGVAEREGIDADIVKGGVLEVAYTPAQLKRLQAFVEERARLGRDRPPAAQRGGVGRSTSTSRTPTAAPTARTAHGCSRPSWSRGCADAVERLGVTIDEQTTVTEIHPHRVVTDHGDIAATFVLRATEGFTAGIKGLKRSWLPMNSSMIVTDPLPDAAWDEIGWEGLETLGDLAHAYCYAQRTADGRIAIGGRGVPYRFGSQVDNDGSTQPQTIDALREILVRLFPAQPRRADRPRVVRRAGRAAGLVLDRGAGRDDRPGLGRRLRRPRRRHDQPRRSDAVRPGARARHRADRDCPWVGRKVRQWEPEPFRWLGRARHVRHLPGR